MNNLLIIKMIATNKLGRLVIKGTIEPELLSRVDRYIRILLFMMRYVVAFSVISNRPPVLSSRTVLSA